MEGRNGQTAFSCVCEKCGRTLYEGEMLNISGKYVCEPCAQRCVFGEFSPHRKARGAPSGFLTFIFSLHPGAGQMYLGLMKRGLFQMCLFYGCIFLCASSAHVFFGLFIPMICIYSFFDALSLRRRLVCGEYVPDELGGIGEFMSRNRRLVVLALVIMLIMGFFSSAMFSGTTATRVVSVESQSGGVEVIVGEESPTAGGPHAYQRTIYVPPAFAPFKTLTPLLLICVGGVIVIKSGKKSRRDGGEPRSERPDVYDSND